MSKEHKRTCGFRFSVRDAIAIVLVSVLTIALWELTAGIIIVAPITLGHFFLFCNIFRIRRYLELTWAATFIVNVTVLLYFTDVYVGWALPIQLPITAVLIIIGIRQPWYHGVCARKWNAKHIDDYLEGTIQ